eukprot:scaffold18210_cov98-Isochrysis_galbana.AAC.1
MPAGEPMCCAYSTAHHREGGGRLKKPGRFQKDNAGWGTNMMGRIVCSPRGRRVGAEKKKPAEGTNAEDGVGDTAGGAPLRMGLGAKREGKKRKCHGYWRSACVPCARIKWRDTKTKPPEPAPGELPVPGHGKPSRCGFPPPVPGRASPAAVSTAGPTGPQNNHPATGGHPTVRARARRDKNGSRCVADATGLARRGPEYRRGGRLYRRGGPPP